MKKLLFLLFFLFPICATAQNVNGNITLSATASDVTAIVGDTECGILNVQFFNGAAPLGQPITTPDSNGKYTLPLDTTTLPNGNYVITAKAKDKAGSSTDPTKVCDGSAPNVGTSNALTLVINNSPKDSAAPTINITVIVTVTP